MTEPSDGAGGPGPAGEPGGPARRTCYRHPDRYAPVRCQRCDQPICTDCMTPASVGFQCPPCVQAGQKATRQGRTAFGGTFSSDPTITSMALLAINVVVWLAVQASGGRDSRLVDLLGLRGLGICSDGFSGYPNLPRAACEAQPGLTYLPGFGDGALWQPLTSLFTHVDLLHIGFNMAALFFLAPQLERVLGRVRLLAVYLLSGLAGSLAVLWVGPPYTPTIGASGCIFGLLGALLIVFVRRRLPLGGLLFWLGLNAVITFSVPNISWQAHLGGFVGGLVTMAVLAYAPRRSRIVVQAAGLAAFTVLLLAGFALRLLVG
ncbi:rhomboid family intramembrane serine protease [Nocardioidaceae bacterium]|nr:rhomboid family intramembrane serine protease [Nocardioidaceae bacterium]